MIMVHRYGGSITLYTCIMGGKDDLKCVPESDFIDRVCYTDDVAGASGRGWRVEEFSGPVGQPRMDSRYPKWMPRTFTRTRYSVWIDGDVQVRDLSFVEDCVKSLHDGVAHPPHPTYTEIEKDIIPAMNRWPDLRGSRLGEQVGWYRSQGFDGTGLLHCKVIARDNDNERAIMVSSLVWSEMVRWGHDYDQPAVPFCYWLSGVVPGVLPQPHDWPGKKIVQLLHKRES